MDSIQKHLQKYSKLTPPEESKKKVILKTLKDECGILLEEKQIKLFKEGVFLNCHPTIRSEIIQQQRAIITALLEKHQIRISFIR